MGERLSPIQNHENANPSIKREGCAKIKKKPWKMTKIGQHASQGWAYIINVLPIDAIFDLLHFYALTDTGENSYEIIFDRLD